MHSNYSEARENRGRVKTVDSFVGGDGSAAARERRSRCAVICAFSSELFSGFRGTTSFRKGVGVGWAEQTARAGLRTWLEIQRPRGLSVRVRTPPSTLPPFLLVGPLRAPDRTLCARALPLFSLLRLRRVQLREVLLVFASHWPGALPFFPAFRLSQNKRDLQPSALGKSALFGVVFKLLSPL